MEPHGVLAPQRRQSYLIREASQNDVAGMVHALFEGSRAAYVHLPDSEIWLPIVVARIASRGPGYFEELLGEITRRRLARRIFVAVTSDHRIAGMIDTTLRDDGAGQLHSWNVLPEFHGERSPNGSTVGGALMVTALDYLGAVDVYSNTTLGTVGLRAHLKYGFEIDDSIPTHDPRLKMPSTWEQAGCPTTVLVNGTSTDVGRQVILVRRASTDK